VSISAGGLNRIGSRQGGGCARCLALPLAVFISYRRQESSGIAGRLYDDEGMAATYRQVEGVGFSPDGRADGPARSPWPWSSRRTCCRASCHHPSHRKRCARNPGLVHFAQIVGLDNHDPGSHACSVQNTRTYIRPSTGNRATLPGPGGGPAARATTETVTAALDLTRSTKSRTDRSLGEAGVVFVV